MMLPTDSDPCEPPSLHQEAPPSNSLILERNRLIMLRIRTQRASDPASYSSWTFKRYCPIRLPRCRAMNVPVYKLYALLLSLLLAGCSSGRCSVSGQVSYDGQPIPEG